MASTTVEELITKYNADPTQWIAGSQKMIGASKNLAKVIDAGQKKAKGFGSTVGKGLKDAFAKATKGMDVNLPSLGDFANLGKVVLGSIAALTVGLGTAGLTAMKQAGEFDALNKALLAVSGSAQIAKSDLADLKVLAKLPGIDLNDAIQGFVNLRRSDLDANFSKNLIRETGNANALSGGGSAEFGQIMRAITQIANKPFLQGDELVQLMEARIPAYKIVKDSFGTSDTEELKRRGITSRQVLEEMVKTLSKTERVAGGAKNDFENLNQALLQGFVAAGAALNVSLLPKVREFTNILEEMSDNGAISRTFEDIASMLTEAIGGGNSEDILYDLLAETKTVAAGMTQLILNVKGFVDAISGILDWLTTPITDEGKKRKADREAQSQDADSLMEQRQRFQDEAEAEKTRAQKKRNERAKAIEERRQTSPPKSTKVDSLASVVTASQQTATNTARMVDLQRKQVEITQMVLGGGGASPISAVEMSALTRSRRRTTDINVMIGDFANAVYQMGYSSAVDAMIARQRGR